MEKIALVIPCYNCSKQLIRLLEQLKELPIHFFERILIVDNQSDVEHLEKIKKYLQNTSGLEKIVLFQNNTNLGLGASFKRSWLYLKKQGIEAMVFLHGDNQADLRDYFYAITHNQIDMNDIALGARFMPSSILSNYSLKRKLGNLFFNVLVSFLYRKKISEIGSGLNYFPLNSLNEREIQILPNHIAFDFEMLLMLLKSNRKIVFFPISWKSVDEKTTINELRVFFQLIYISLKRLLINLELESCLDNNKIEEEDWTLI